VAAHTQEIATLRDINAGLEKRIVTRMQTLVTLYEGARALATTDPNVLYKSILHFVAKTLEAEAAALYLRTEDGWRLYDSVGWKTYEKHPTFLKTGEGITGLAGASGKIVSIRDFIGTAQPQDVLADCIMAGPVRRGAQGDIVAVLSIQDIPFLQFNSATLNLLMFLLDWASRSVAHAFEVSALKEDEIWDPVFQIFSYRYFQSRAAQEWLRSKTYYLPLCIGMVRMEGADHLSKDAEDRLLQIVAQVLRESCREMDVVARYTDADVPFAFILMTASPGQADEICKKILTHFARLELAISNPTYADIRLRLGVSNFAPKVANVDSMISEAREALE
jgi:diguanylate cyclase (GGDEF)-like protein